MWRTSTYATMFLALRLTQKLRPESLDQWARPPVVPVQHLEHQALRKNVLKYPALVLATLPHRERRLMHGGCHILRQKHLWTQHGMENRALISCIRLRLRSHANKYRDMGRMKTETESSLATTTRMTAVKLSAGLSKSLLIVKGMMAMSTLYCQIPTRGIALLFMNSKGIRHVDFSATLTTKRMRRTTESLFVNHALRPRRRKLAASVRYSARRLRGCRDKTTSPGWRSGRISTGQFCRG